jgi:hypothetical protein
MRMRRFGDFFGDSRELVKTHGRIDVSHVKLSCQFLRLPRVEHRQPLSKRARRNAASRRNRFLNRFFEVSGKGILVLLFLTAFVIGRESLGTSYIILLAFLGPPRAAARLVFPANYLFVSGFCVRTDRRARDSSERCLPD